MYAALTSIISHFVGRSPSTAHSLFIMLAQPVEMTSKESSYSYNAAGPNVSSSISQSTYPGTTTTSTTATSAAYRRLDADALKHTQPEVRIILRPIAAPSCLGFCMFFLSTFIVATYLASWWGRTDSQSIFWPFVAVTGLGQFIAGFYGFSARDNLACVIHVTWGSFFIAYGIQQFLINLGLLGQWRPPYSPSHCSAFASLQHLRAEHC